MFRAFLLVLLSTAVWAWQKTRLPEAPPLDREELKQALSNEAGAPGLAHAFDRVVAHQRAPASLGSGKEEVEVSKDVPPGVPVEVAQIEPHFYEDPRDSARVLSRALREVPPTQIEARLYLLNLAMTLGSDASGELVEIGQAALEQSVPVDSTAEIDPKVFEGIGLSLRLIAYNTLNADELKALRAKLEANYPHPAVLKEIDRIFPRDTPPPPAEAIEYDNSR